MEANWILIALKLLLIKCTELFHQFAFLMPVKVNYHRGVVLFANRITISEPLTKQQIPLVSARAVEAYDRMTDSNHARSKDLFAFRSERATRKENSSAYF